MAIDTSMETTAITNVVYRLNNHKSVFKTCNRSTTTGKLEQKQNYFNRSEIQSKAIQKMFKYNFYMATPSTYNPTKHTKDISNIKIVGKDETVD